MVERRSFARGREWKSKRGRIIHMRIHHFQAACSYVIEELERRTLLSAADPTLAAWFRADSIAASSGAPVAAWIDSAGDGFDASQPNAVNQPHLVTGAINGQPAVHFDAGSGTSLALPRPVSGDFTIVAVFRSTQGISHSQLWYDAAGIVDGEVSGVANDYGLSLNGLGQVLGGTGNPDKSAASGLGFNDGRAHVATFTRTAATGLLSIYVDGLRFTTVNGAGTQPLVAPPRLTIGATQTGAQYFTGDIAEVRIYSVALSPATRATAEAQLEAQYGIGSLPAHFFNPVINTDFPDPGAVVGPDGTYYAFATNGNGRNVQAEHSTDLVHWTQLADALPTLPTWAQPGRTWGPDAAVMADGVHYDLYYTAWSRATGQEAVGVATATNPAGPYTAVGSAPLVAQYNIGGAIDPSVFTATSGIRYLVWKNDGNSMGIDTQIFVQQLSSDGLSLVGSATSLIRQDQPWEGSVVEGPNLIQHNGKYYLFYSANAYNTAAYAEGYAVSNSIFGPYTKPGGPLVATENGVIGPGGGRVVTGPDGNTWMLYHSWENNFAYRSMSIDRLDWNGDVPVLRGPSRAGQPVPVAPTVVGRHTFYNNSSFDGNDPAAAASDDAAIATDKVALLPNQPSAASNYTNYVGGLNGVMIDVSRLPLRASLSAMDFTLKVGSDPAPSGWAAAPSPTSVTLRRGAGTGGSDRITLIWADGAIRNEWLQVTVRSDANTALATADTFYFGNLVGDANGDGRVSISDIAMAKSLNGQTANITSPADFNRNGLITISDIAIGKANNGNSLAALFTPTSPAIVTTPLSATTAAALYAITLRRSKPATSVLPPPPLAAAPLFTAWAQPSARKRNVVLDL
jgi:arabinan endo-1,5-alpha-L-arabinosidase